MSDAPAGEHKEGWWKRNAERRKKAGAEGSRRLGQIVKSPFKATFGLLGRGKKEFLKEQKLKDDPTRGIAETPTHWASIISEKVAGVLRTVVGKPAIALGNASLWALQLPAKLADHAVRFACKIPGAIPGIAALLLHTGVIGTQALKYEDQVDAEVSAAVKGHDHHVEEAGDKPGKKDEPGKK